MYKRQELWDEQRNDIVDPRVLAALEFMRSTTTFQLGRLLDEQPTSENQTQPMITIEPTEQTPTPKPPKRNEASKAAVAAFDLDDNVDFEATEVVSVKRPQRVARAAVPANAPPVQQLSLTALVKKYGFTGRFLKACLLYTSPSPRD